MEKSGKTSLRGWHLCRPEGGWGRELQWSEGATDDKALKQGVPGLFVVRKVEQGEQQWKSSKWARSEGCISHSKDFRLSWMRSEGTRVIDQELSLITFKIHFLSKAMPQFFFPMVRFSLCEDAMVYLGPSNDRHLVHLQAFGFGVA